ncbi:MAG TPA: class I SAM-dependent methyltransferase [Chloroflexota bacterium]
MERPRVSPELYTREYYGHVEGHRDWDATHGRRLPPRLARALRLAKLEPGLRCLDAGAGRGEVVFQCALAGADAVGIDYSADGVAIAQEALAGYLTGVRERCQFLQMDVRALKFEDASFDRVFMLDLVEHLNPEELTAAFTEARRVLRTGGLLVVHTEPNRNYAELAVKAYGSSILGPALRPLVRWVTGSAVPFSSYRDSMHVNEQSPASLRQALIGAGFNPRVWCSGLYGVEELRDPRSVLKRVLFTGWPVSALGPLADTLCINVWAVAER